MTVTTETIVKLEKFRNREYTANEAIADLATEIRGMIDNRLALNAAVEKIGGGLLIAGKNRAWTIEKPVFDVTDTATGEIIPASEGEIWRELRRRSGLEPRAFYLAMARAADIEVPGVLQATAAAWNVDAAGPAPAGWTAPTGDGRWKKTGDFGQVAAVAADLLEKTKEAEIKEFEESLTAEKMELLCPFFLNSPDDFFPEDKFSPALLAEKFISGFKPIHDGSSFFLYQPKQGIWKEVHENSIAQKIMAFLGDRAKAAQVRDALYLAESRTYMDPETIQPKNRFLVNLKNGVLDIRTRELRPHDRRFFFRNIIPIDFDPSATCPRWYKFLSEIFSDDPGKERTLQDFSGYALYPEIFIHKALFLIGSGGNGKSTFLNILCQLIGTHNLSAIEPYMMGDKFLLGTLRGAMLNSCGDIETRSRIQSAALKAVISGDLIQADQKYKDPIIFRPIAKHIFSANSLPNLTDQSYGMMRRLIIVRFNQTFKNEHEDKELETKLTAELPGILNWALTGLARVMQIKEIHETEAMDADKMETITLLDSVRMFIDENCTLSPTVKTKKSSFFTAYTRFCETSNIEPLSKRKFYEQLSTNFPEIDEYRPHGEARHLIGIDVITDAETDA